MPTCGRRIIYFFMLCCFIVCTGCANDNEKQVQAYIDNARQFLAQKKPQTAIIEYRNALKLAPKNDVVLFELAESYILTGQVSSAIRYYNLAAKANPASLIAYLRLAQIYMQKNELLEARNYVSKVLEKFPTSIQAYHILSGIQIRERDIDSAIETLNKALSMDNKNIKTYIALAKLYTSNKALDKAEDVYKAAIGLDSASREAYMGLVGLYSLQKKWEAAEALLLSVQQTSGIKLKKNTDIARFYQGRRQFDKAEAYFQKAVDSGPDRVEPLINLAEFYTRQGDKDKAIVTMENARTKQPDNPLVLSGLAQVYLEFNQVDDAEKPVDNILKKNKDNVDGLFLKGRILMARQDYKTALTLFDQVIAIDQLNAKAYYYRAMCIERRGATDRPEQKIFRAAAGMLDKPEEFEKDQVKGNLLAALTVNPNLVDARFKLMELYLIDKNVNKAKEQMEEIFKLAPPNIKSMTLLSGLKLLEGDYETAEKILISINKEEPGYIPAYIRLGMLYRSTGKPEKAIDYLKTAFDMNPDQTGLVRMMTDIYINQKKFTQALALVNSLSGKSLKKNVAFFDNLKGEIYLADKKTETAFDYFLRAADQAPRFIEPRMHLATLLKQKKKYWDALEYLKKIEIVTPDYVPALMDIGLIFDINDDLVQAEAYYRKVLEREPKHPKAANNLAFILSEKKGSTDEALFYAGIAREKEPKNPYISDTLGWIYYQKGNYLNALSELDDSLKINPDNALTCYHYAMALYRNKEFEKARQYFQKALNIDPNFKSAETARRMLN